MSIFDASEAYKREGRAMIVLAGKEYGTGSSRDWAAKGSALLGIRAVIAESYERIHRANLVGMGVLPLLFGPGEGWRQLGLTGSERFVFEHVEDGIRQARPIDVTAYGTSATTRFKVVPQLLTQAERALMASGGMPVSVLQSFITSASARDGDAPPSSTSRV